MTAIMGSIMQLSRFSETGAIKKYQAQRAGKQTGQDSVF
jgi:hypothetical protein